MRLAWILVLATTMFSFARATAAGPITFSSALPVSEGIGILRSQVKLVHKSGDAVSQNRILTVTAIPLVFVYGVSPALALFGMLPYVGKRMDITMGAKRIHRQTQGLGDGLFFARYTVYQADYPGDTLRIAPFIGLKMPTGAYDKRDAFGLLPRPLQSGSGSWDPFAGITITRQTLNWEFDAAVSYRINRQASNFEFGNEARITTSFQYRMLPRSLDNVAVPAFVYAVLESSLIRSGKNRVAGATDRNSGGMIWKLVPGLQFVTSRYVLETAIQIPVIQRLNGSELKTDRVWTAGFRWNF